MALIFDSIAETSVPVSLAGLQPVELQGRKLSEIERLEVQHGNRKIALAELFRVSGSPESGQLHLLGDLSGVHQIGANLTGGVIQVEGSAGRHLGSHMSGGEIHVVGDVGDYAATAMQGGRIVIHGRAGNALGSSAPGTVRGMTGGSILVHGDAGDEVGRGMRRGLIAAAGSAGEFVGTSMLAGSIVVAGNCGRRAGAGMRRGTIALLSAGLPALLPTFRHACRFRPSVLRMLLLHLRELHFPIDEVHLTSAYDLFHGDMLELGRGEILARAG